MDKELKGSTNVLKNKFDKTSPNPSLVAEKSNIRLDAIIQEQFNKGLDFEYLSENYKAAYIAYEHSLNLIHGYDLGPLQASFVEKHKDRAFKLWSAGNGFKSLDDLLK